MRFINVLILVAIMMTAGAALAQENTYIFFSEYIEGSSNNKALEIYNNTNEPLDFSRVTIELYSNANTTPTTYTMLPIMIASQDVYVVANAAADPLILAVADDTDNSGVTYYNGNDALLLYLDEVLVDSIGVPGENIVWGTEPCTTGETTLVRMAAICAGDIDATPVFDPADEFDCYAQNTFTYLGSHTADCEPVGNDNASWSGIKALYR